MRRIIALIPSLALLLAAGPAYAGGSQGGLGDDGTPPPTLNPGDANRPGAFAGTVFIEIRDVPITETGSPSLIGGRFMTVMARYSDGDSFRFISANFICGDPAVIDPCTDEMICTIGRGNKERCDLGPVVDSRKQGEILAVVVSLIAPRIVAAYGLPSSTVLELTKLKQYVQAGPIADVDGVLSFGVIADAAFDTP